MNTDDTIAAVSTPPGSSGIGIVRLSGRDAVSIVESLFRSHRKKTLAETPSHRILYGHIIDPRDSEVLDEVLLSVMKAPKTYTKEDIVEINCHGGSVPVRRILELVLRSGARLAEPGEFTRRAFLNGRIDLAQAEAVSDIISSLTIESQKAAVRQLSGLLSARIEDIRQRLIDLAALTEAHIDFPEEDIEQASQHEMRAIALSISKDIQKLIDSARYGTVLREGIRTALVGRPNVGKSSLLNALLERDRVIVSETPGTTRDVIEEYLNVNGLPLRIMDTAGIRDVSDLTEQEGVRRSLQTMEDADLLLLVLDGSEALHETDRILLEKARERTALIIINKSDLPGQFQWNDSRYVSVRTSATDGTGLTELKDLVVEIVLGGRMGEIPEMVTNVRHVKSLEQTLAAMTSYTAGIEKGTSPEFLALDLREALDGLGEITGITMPEDILNRIFSNFCIGK